MTTEEWRPVRVVKIDREIASEEEHERTLQRDLGECQSRLRTLRTERAKELEPREASGE